MAFRLLLDTTVNATGDPVKIVHSGNREGVLQIDFRGTSPVGTVTIYGRADRSMDFLPIAAPFLEAAILEVVLCPEMYATVSGIGGTNPRVVVGVLE